MSLTQTEIVDEVDYENVIVDGTTAPAQFTGTGIPSSIPVYYKFTKYFAYDYWGIVKDLYYVDVANARLGQTVFPFVTDDLIPGLMTANLSGHVNDYSILTNISCRITWTYNLNTGFQTEDGSSWYTTNRAIRSIINSD